jgi:hypothetical protein
MIRMPTPSPFWLRGLGGGLLRLTAIPPDQDVIGAGELL